MTLLPKDPPVIDEEFMRELRVSIIGRCEHPGGCHHRAMLDCHHIKGRGLGGGGRKDTEGNLIILCRKHHQFAHTKGVAYRPVLYHALEVRTDHEQRQIRAFFRSRAS